jgi:hypothetical protein
MAPADGCPSLGAPKIDITHTLVHSTIRPRKSQAPHKEFESESVTTDSGTTEKVVILGVAKNLAVQAGADVHHGEILRPPTAGAQDDNLLRVSEKIPAADVP